MSLIQENKNAQLIKFITCQKNVNNNSTVNKITMSYLNLEIGNIKFSSPIIKKFSTTINTPYFFSTKTLDIVKL